MPKAVPNREAATPLVEVHSIDHIPENERGGKLWHQGPFWFMINATLLTVLSGVYPTPTNCESWAGSRRRALIRQAPA